MSASQLMEFTTKTLFIEILLRAAIASEAALGLYELQKVTDCVKSHYDAISTRALGVIIVSQTSWFSTLTYTVQWTYNTCTRFSDVCYSIIHTSRYIIIIIMSPLESCASCHCCQKYCLHFFSYDCQANTQEHLIYTHDYYSNVCVHVDTHFLELVMTCIQHCCSLASTGATCRGVVNNHHDNQGTHHASIW